MRKTFFIGLAFVAASAVMAAQRPGAGQTANGAVRLKAAMTQALIDGDANAAIERYRALATEFAATDRDVAARALLQLATTYEKLGQPEASATYQRLVREFPDAVGVAAAARERLAVLRPARAQGNVFEPRKVATLSLNVIYDLSPSGDQIVFSDGADIVIRDVSSGQQVVLVAGSGDYRGTEPVFSSDGRQVAYQLYSTAAGGGRFGTPPGKGHSLQVIGTQRDAKPRTVVGPDAGLFGIIPVGWSPDGTSIIATTRTVNEASPPNGTLTLVSVSIATGAVRTIGSLGHPGGRSRLRLSPDGRFVAYSASHSAAEPWVPGTPTNPLVYRVFVASLEGFSETEVVKIVGSHTNPMWTPDGSRILFSSNRFGAQALWSVPVQSGQAAGSPSVVRAGFSAIPLAISSTGALFYLDNEVRGVQTRIVERGGHLVTSFPGGGGDWSPNGRYFAFKPAVGVGSEVVVRDMETAAERSYRLENVTAALPHWLGNGGFVVAARQGPDGETLYFCDISSGAFRRLYPLRTPEFQRWGFTTPDDGSRIYSVFTSDQNQPLTGIVAVNPATGENSPVAPFPSPLPRSMPGLHVNRDGTSVVVMTPANDLGMARLFVMGVDGSGYREVGGPFPVSRTPDLVRWTPDSTSILYVTTSNGKSRVMRIPVGGGTPEFEGVEVDDNILNIDPSPDGTRLAYSTAPRPTTELWAVDNILAFLAGR